MSEEEVVIDAKRIWAFLIILGAGLILGTIALLFYEINSAKNSCEEINGTYKFSFSHTCNGEPYYRYSDGSWDFDWNYTISLEDFD